MGFYGKVNRTDSNFVIDATYGNRGEMEDALLEGDGVFIGRYVLVDYNKGTAIEDNYIRLYKKDSWNYFFSADFASATRAIYSEKPYFITNDNGQTAINPEYKEDIKTNPYLIFQDQPIYVVSETGDYIFYQCVSRQGTTKYPLFKLMSESPLDADNYYYNFTQDRERYKDAIGRGWDSTVWQKIYVDETEQYAMIAELNSVVPTFDITNDAPTLSPVAPHFDADRTNVYYRLHLQPSWGLRVAKAGSKDESDTYFSHSGSRWNPETNKTDWFNEQYDGAIYFNEKGFNPLVHHKLSTLKDEIKLLPTGKSGNRYNISHDSSITAKEEKEDIQELTIHLPSIGNSISKMWDMIYGEGEAEGNESEGLRRNDNIDWDNVGGLRLVSTKKDGNGFEYNTKEVNTLAGCINSVHDLMGMIITNDKNEELELDEALVNRIYYRNGKFYFKNLKYRYEPVPDNAIEIPNMAQFSKDNSYYKNNDNYYKEQEGYQHGNKYFELISGEEIIEKPLAEENWESGKYWYKDAENNYILDNNTQPDENQEYYKINEKDLESVITVDHKQLYFFPNTYSDAVFNELFPTSEREEISKKVEGNIVVENIVVKGSGLFYWGTDTETGYQNYLPFEKTISTNSTLFYIKDYIIETSTTINEDIIKTYDFQNAVKTQISTIPFQNNKFYYLNENKYQLLDSLADITLADINEESNSYKKYYAVSNDENSEESITFIPIGYDFYEPGLYYYKDNVDYILAKERIKLPNTIYYTIDASQAEVDTNVTFYEPNKYFYYNGEEYVIDTNETMRENETYYKDIYNTYVIETGEKCNPNVNYANLGINIGYREEKYEWKELNGFSRTLNTINGLILKINNILKLDDTLTRDNKTVQGCINQMNDIINTIDTLKPNHIIAVNEFGHMTSMAARTDNWINIQINEDNNDEVVITHTPIAPNKPSEDSLELKFGDEFDLEIYCFDDRGHNSSKTIHHIKIPQGDLTEAPITDSNIITKLAFDKPTGVLSTTRENISNIKLADYEKSSDNNDIVNTDTLGQALSKLQTQIIEEENTRSNIINDLNMNSESNTHFISKITQTNGQVAVERAAAGTLQIADADGSYIIPDSASAISKTDSIAVAFGKVEAQIKTENTNRNKAINTLTNNLNKEIQNRTDAINALDATLSTETTAEVITSITQTNGKLTSIGKAAVGNLTLNGWTLGQSVVNNESIADTDTVNSAFAKTQRQINANKVALTVLNGNSTTQGSVAYQIAEAIKTENLGQYALNSSLENLEDRVEAIEKKDESWDNGLVRITALEGLIDANKVAVWDKAEENVQADWNTIDETADSFILNKPDLSNMVETTTEFSYNYNETTTLMTLSSLMEYIATLEARIYALENPTIEEESEATSKEPGNENVE